MSKFWKITAGVIAGLSSILSAFWFGYQVGKDHPRLTNHVSKTQYSEVCAKFNRIIIVSLQGESD